MHALQISWKYKPHVYVCIKVLNPLSHFPQLQSNHYSEIERSTEMLLSLTETVLFQLAHRF